MVGNIETGEQLVLCADHLADGGEVKVTSSTPPLCQMCEAQPPVVVQEALVDHSSLALCSECLLLTGRMSWLAAPREFQEAVDTMIEAGGPGAGGGERLTPRGRGRRSAHAATAGEPVEPGQAGPDDGVAVDVEGETPTAAAEGG
jgi:hypothetical protein